MLLNVRISATLKQYVITCIANFSFFILGMDRAWISPSLVMLRAANQTYLVRPITEDEGAWIVSVSAIGGLPVLFFMGYLIDRFGRKLCILLAFVPRLIACSLILFTRGIWELLLARVLFGIGNVMSLSVMPTYVSEIASKEIRGALGATNQILLAIGALIMLSIGPFVSYPSLNIIFSAVVIAVFIPQLFLPESPYFLYVKGNKEDSLKVLTSIRNSDERARDEIKEYTLSGNENISKKDLLKNKTTLKSIGIVILLAIGYHMIGYSAVSAYLQTIFESTNTSLRPEIASAVIGCVQLLGCVSTIFLTDRFGRKPILTVTLIGLAIGMFGLGWFFKLTQNNVEITGILNFLPLSSLILVKYCYNAGIGSVFYMLVAELFDGPSRAIGVSVAVFFAALFVFIVSHFFSAVLTSIGPTATYWIFGGSSLATCLFIITFIPETKGKTFTEIQQALGRKEQEI